MAKKKTRNSSKAKTLKNPRPDKKQSKKPDKKQSKKPAKKQSKKPGKKPAKKDDPRQRLQRVMANAGIGSRRECELIIEEGRVEVDGQVVTTLGVKVDPAKQEIVVDAQDLVIQRPQYFMLNKPPGILSTSKDPAGRPRVIDLIKTDKRVYNVGRLDQSSEGLIIVTNDGDLANQLTHPRYGVEKKYHVQVVGVPAAGELRKLEEGVYIAEGLARATKAKFLKRAKNGCWLEITLAEGRNREIRRMLAGIGHKVRTLRRVSIGPLKLGELPLGAHRQLTPMELKSLKRASEGPEKTRRKKPVKKKPGERKSDSQDRTSRKFKPSKSSAKRPAKKKKPLSRRKSASGTRGAERGRPAKKGASAKPASRAAKPAKRKRR